MPIKRKDVSALDTLETITTRRSVRAYRDTAVPQDVLEQVLSAALYAPSWKNSQTVNYIVVQSPEAKERLLSALPPYNAKTVSTAPVSLLMTTKRGRCGYERDGSYTTKKEDRWEMFDAGIACQTLCLAAWDRGLGTCIMGIYDEERLPALFDVPQDQYVTAVISLGYPDQSPLCPKRKPLEEKVRYV